jgi:hypothetical protein
LKSASRGDLYWAIAIALLTGTLYFVTLRPDVGGTEDSPKFQFLGQVLGTAHTPGYPFYTIATYLFTRPPIGTLAFRVNLFSAVCGVLSCVLIFLMARRLGVSRLLSAAAALACATGFPLWSNAITAEVYTLSALMSTWTIYLLIAWAAASARATAPKQPHGLLYAACAVFAAGLGNHLTIVGLLPAALIYGIAHDRGVLKPRVIGIAAIIGVLGVAQYGFIALRTVQGAPYLEARATTLRGVYDVIIARDVSWARFYQAADKVVGIEVPMLLDGLRVHMGTVAMILAVAAIGIALWRRNRDALLIAGGAAGTLAMIANLWGDVVGFITPVIVLLWPLAAYAAQTLVDAIRRLVRRSLAEGGRLGKGGHRIELAVAAVALTLPIWNLFAIYPAIEPLRRPGDGPALRALYPRLPPNSAVVAHNYFIARIFNYLDFSDEYDPDPSPKFIPSDVNQLRAAAAEGREVFALDEAVPWLQSQGFRFEPTALSRQPFADWIAQQPDGTITAAAAAGMVLPRAWLAAMDARTPPAARPSNFAALTWAKGSRTAQIEQSDAAVSAARDVGGRRLEISSGDDGLLIKWGDDVLVTSDRGLVAVVITPAGRVAARWQFPGGEQPDALAPPIAFVLRGETACEVLRTGLSVDVSAIAGEGSWYATVDGRQIPAEISIAGGGSPADWRHRLFNGRGTAAIDHERSRLLLDGAPGTRAAFQFSLPATQDEVRATLETTGHAVRVCQAPVPPLPANGALDIYPAFEARFGAGWHFAEEAGTQRFRWSRQSSVMQWRMDSPSPLRLILPLRAAHTDGATIHAAINGAEAGSCTLPTGAWTECRLDVDASHTRSGINELTLTSNTVAPVRKDDARELAFVMQSGRVRGGR